MAFVSLSRRDLNVLEKIKDPESDPSRGALIDASLPKDPHVRDPSAYEQVSRRERDIIRSMQQLEMRLAAAAGLPRSDAPDTPAPAPAANDPAATYRACVSAFGDLISEFPDYASARNNRAQALRRLYGDTLLLLLLFGTTTTDDTQQQDQNQALIPSSTPESDSERLAAAETALSDLDRSIALLTPPTPYTPLSPQAARTLAMAHTQRAALYHATARALPLTPQSTMATATANGTRQRRREAGWTRLEFEEAASRDFAAGGRYGSDIAKALAVGTNPTAKLCGEMVREAMRKEYGPAFGG